MNKELLNKELDLKAPAYVQARVNENQSLVDPSNT